MLSKTDALMINLEELLDRCISVDVVCITEHFIKAGFECFLNLPNYVLAECFSRENIKRGGACILVKNGLKWKELSEFKKLSIVNVFECCAIELTDYKIAIICIYRVSTRRNNFDVFFNVLEKLLVIASKLKCNNVLIAGDINIDMLKNNNVTSNLECLLSNYNFKLALKQPTRLISKTCIDNFAHNYEKACKAEVLEFGLSDHTAQLIKLPVKKIIKLKHWYKMIRDYSKDNIQKFKMCIGNLTFSELYNLNDPDLAYNYFLQEFRLFYNLCFPLKQIKIKVTNKPKWISKGLKTCSKRKRALLWKYRKSPTSTNKFNYKKYAKLFKKIINLTKRAQNIYKIKTSDNKSKTTWQIIQKARLNIPTQSISKIKVGNEHISNPQQIAEAFNNFFIDKIKPLEGYGNGVGKNLRRMLGSMFLAPSVPLQIFDIIKNLRNTNSVGHDGIATKIIKSVNKEICHHLSYIINLSIEKGIFPDELKVTIVKPLFKKADKESMECYRPIALISIFSKIFEKYLYNNLNDYLEKNNILCNEQKGFRKNKTINMALYDFYKNVITHVDNRTPVCSIYCDMTQAFDYVDHNILIHKLESYGIRGNVLSLVQSYLSNRQQKTEICRLNLRTKSEDISSSTERLVKYGVPQGSVLGPLLFIIYINDLPNAIKQPMTLFADDSTITINCNDINSYKNDINESLNSIITWLNINNLKINLNKTHVMHFNQRPITPSNIDVNYKGTVIAEVDTTRFLGLQIDQKLNWKAHILELNKKISSSAYALFRLSATVNIDALLTAYYGLVESVLRYGVIFWGNSTDRDVAFKSQKRCIRAMFGLQTTDSCMPYFIKHRILTLPSLYIMEMALFVRANPNLFPRLSDKIKRNRRDGTKLCLQQAKTALLRKSVVCMAPKIYNKIPKIYKSMNNNLFKNKFKNLLIEKCYYSVTDFLNDNF